MSVHQSTFTISDEKFDLDKFAAEDPHQKILTKFLFGVY